MLEICRNCGVEKLNLEEVLIVKQSLALRLTTNNKEELVYNVFISEANLDNESLASPKSILFFSWKNSGFCMPA